MQKTKKDLSFFGFLQVFNHQFIQKTKQTLSFCNFFKVMTKKNKKKTRGNPKKNKHEPETKHSLKSFVFLVFWFSRGFLVFGFPHGFSPKESSNSWLVPLNLEKTKNQKTSRKPKNQKTKTFQRMFGLRLMFGFFWFSSSFFGFFWSWPWKN